MAKRRPPFSWLGAYRRPVFLVILVAVAGLFRFWRLSSLPPGLHTGEANIGLQALKLAQHGVFPGLNPDNSYAPLWIWLEALPVKLFGHTILALRLWPALLGVVGVVAIWLWARDWFNERVAWIAAFLAAVTPWAVTLTRNATPVALMFVLVPLTFWLCARAAGSKALRWWIPSGIILALDAMSGPLGWLMAAVVIVLALCRAISSRDLFAPLPSRIIGSLIAVIGIGGLITLVITSWNVVKHLPSNAHLSLGIGHISSSIGGTLLMFNLAGDQDFRHNLGGQPLLNAFVGLMLVAGLLVAITRFTQRRYRILLGLFVAFLLPAAFSTANAPNAAHAAAVLPVAAILAAVGISYMLELWYGTFPINSAARVTGQAAILVLLALTLFQGYTQYFRAWAGSSETYVAYNEAAVGASAYLKADKTPSTTQRLVIATADEQPVISYLASDTPNYQLIDPSALVPLPVVAGAHEFIITAAARDDAAKALSAKFPGGVLRPHISAFNQAELYYDYGVTK